MKNNTAQVLETVYKRITSQYERDYFTFHRYRYRFILDKIDTLSLKKDARILDVGCYPPHIFDALSESGFSVYGISSTHEQVKRPHVAVINIEKNPFPYKKGFFDVIIFAEVMEHLVVDPRIYLKKMARVLKQDGTLLITTPNAAGLHKIIPLFLGRSTYFTLEQLYNTKHGDSSIYHRHNREYTIHELKIILEDSGFKSRVGHANAYRSYLRQEVRSHLPRQVVRYVSYLITTIVPHFQDSLYVTAKHRLNKV